MIYDGRVVLSKMSNPKENKEPKWKSPAKATLYLFLDLLVIKKKGFVVDLVSKVTPYIISEEEPVQITSEDANNKKFAFIIGKDAKAMQVQCESTEDYTKWVQAFTAVKKYYDEKQQGTSSTVKYVLLYYSYVPIEYPNCH